MEEYDLWFLSRNSKKWRNIEITDKSIENAMDALYNQLDVSLKYNMKATKFKIAKVGDISWQEWI